MTGIVGHGGFLMQPASGGGGGSGWLWDPATAGATATVSNGGLDANTQGAHILGDTGYASGVRQFELTMLISPPGNYWMVGVGNASVDPYFPGHDANGVGHYGINGFVYGGGSNVPFGAGFTAADIIGVVVNFTTGTVYFYKNGTLQGTDTTSAGLGFPTGTLFPMIGDGGIGSPGCNSRINTTLTYPVGGASPW